MSRIVVNQLVKIKNTGDTLATLIAPHDPYRYFVGVAISINGGPDIETEEMIKLKKLVGAGSAP